MLNRRNFIGQTTAALGTTALLTALDHPAYALFHQTIGTNDQINIGVIGDSDANVLDKRMSDLKALNVHAAKVKRNKDYRALLDQKYSIFD